MKPVLAPLPSCPTVVRRSPPWNQDAGLSSNLATVIALVRARLRRTVVSWFLVLPILLGAKGICSSAIAAEYVYLSFGPVERAISVDALERYAEGGIVDPTLAPYLDYLPPNQREHLREWLLTRLDVSPVAVAQFLYSRQGEILLNQLGELVRTGAYQSGFYAIRSTLILAADDPDGLTPLNTLRHFPLPTLRIDVERTLRVMEAMEDLVNETAGAIATVEEQARVESAIAPPIDFDRFPDLRQSGNRQWRRETLRLRDISRDRPLTLDLYLPLATTSLPTTPAPLIIISHGLGSDRTSYAYLAQHLASYGFAVALPEHPGSNADQIQALMEGRAQEVTEPGELINRPLDIHYILDELERRNQTDPKLMHRLDLQRVGILGQSLGGYTALTLAGASLNLRQLSLDCVPSHYSLNLSLLVQCRTLDANLNTTQFADDRVKAIIAINPIGSSALGPQGFSRIDRPVMIVSGNADTIAPALLEQIRPFTWLSVPERYLMVMRGATHFSTIGASEHDVTLPSELVGPDPAIAQRYMNAISTAFFLTYVMDEPEYEPLLGASYAEQLSQDLLPLRLIQSLDPAQLAHGIANPRDAITPGG